MTDPITMLSIPADIQPETIRVDADFDVTCRESRTLEFPRAIAEHFFADPSAPIAAEIQQAIYAGTPDWRCCYGTEWDDEVVGVEVLANDIEVTN